MLPETRPAPARGLCSRANARDQLPRPGASRRCVTVAAAARHASTPCSINSCRHVALRGQQPFRHANSSSSCRATGVLEGSRTAPAASTAAEVGGTLLRQWLGLPAEAELPMTTGTGPVRDTACELTVCATTITAGDRKHVLLAFVATNAAEKSNSNGSSRPGSPGSASLTLAQLPSPVLHWGCVGSRGDKWQPPPAGWSTWPDVSHDARGGAWQTPFAEQLLPCGVPALTLLLQLPCDGPIRPGGLAFILKSANRWLGNAATFSDFFFSIGSVPGLPAEALAAAAGSAAVAAADQTTLAAPKTALDLKRLAEAPVVTLQPEKNTGSSTSKQKKHGGNEWRQQEHHHHGHSQEPELPNAGRRAKEPPTDETQVCKLTAAELHAAAAAQLLSWVEQQGDLEAAGPGGLQVTQHEFPVKGHPSTPFVMASAAVWQKPDPLLQGAEQDASGRQAVLLLAAMGDVGLTGLRMPGLVLHWSGVAAPDAAGAAAELAEIAAGTVDLSSLPEGWTTLPDLSWDAGSGFWETPMTRHLLAARPAAPGAAAASSGASGPVTASLLDRPASPKPAGAAEGGAEDTYLALLRLPLEGVFRSGGLLFNMRTARRAWIRNAETGGTFFLNTSSHAAQLGLLPAPAAAAPATAAQQQAVEGASQKALAAAGLSEEEIAAFAASMPQPAAAQGAAVAAQPRVGGSSLRPLAAQLLGKGSLDALSSADADMAAHIEAISANRHRAPAADNGRSGSGSSGGGDRANGSSKKQPGSSGGGEREAAAAAAEAVFGPGGVARFLRDFEARPAAAADLLWGCEGPEDDACSDHQDVPDMPPADDVARRIGEMEHKAQRSLMHRFGIAADLVGELLPDIRAAAAAAPASLTWPSGGRQQHDDSGARGRRALAGLVAVAVWLRLSALRLLTWNHNYNVKPREISAALDRLGANLVEAAEAAPQLSGVVLLALSSAGRGGEGDMGQRIRDEILAIQHRNGCKGGMMEQWHQKLHNNSSPDDLAICQALLDYLAAGQQQEAYWASLAAEGITAARLASFDRAITSPPPVFPADSVAGLTADLVAYRRTLAAVHSGADLSAAIDGVLGYDAGECKGKRVKVEPLAAVATPELRKLLAALLVVVQAGGTGGSSSSSGGSSSRPLTPGGGSNKVAAMLEMERCLKLQGLVVAARQCLLPALRGGNSACQGRLRDVIFLDLALELTGRGALEGGLSAVRAAAPSTLLGGLLALLLPPLASACMSALPGQGGNAALVAAYGQLQRLSSDCPGLDAAAKARLALSLLERVRALLAAGSASAMALLQPTAYTLAGSLGLMPGGHAHNNHGVDTAAPVAMLAEEVVRGSAAAALSLLLTAVEPSLRRLAGVAAWSIVSRLPATSSGTLSPLLPGLARVDASLLDSSRPTVLLLRRLDGEEEVPLGVAGVVIVGDCPDVLSHAAVRARNCRIPVVAVPSSEEALVAQVVALSGRHVTLAINGDDVTLQESSPSDGTAAATGQAASADQQQQRQRLAAPALWSPPGSNGSSGSSWVMQAEQFQQGVVGAKAMSSAHLALAAAAPSLQGRLLLPAWLEVPGSVALPHGCFEAVMAAPENAELGQQLQQLAAKVAADAGSSSGGRSRVNPEDLQQLRSLVQQLRPPPALSHELCQQLDALAAASAASASSSAQTTYRWEEVWQAVKGVWASQWNERALAALSKASLPLAELRMGVLLQPLLPARYSWVAHTVDPASGSAGQVVVQLVVGLGEVLVGNHPGRALGGIIQRDSLDAALQQLLSPGSAGQGNGNGRRVAEVPREEELLRAVDIVSFASKAAAVAAPGVVLPEIGGGSGGSGSGSEGIAFMARSDSNAEDLPGFAGAGLFDSLPSRATRTVLLDYSAEPLMWDKAAAAALLWRCALAAVVAEQLLLQAEGGAGGASGMGQAVGMDVEGCVTEDGCVWLLQGRPQV